MRKKLLNLMSGVLLMTSVSAFGSSTDQIIPVAVIGSGCAGLSAASVTGEYGFETVVFSGPLRGGDLNVKTEVGNWPGILWSWGNDIIKTLDESVQRWGVRTENDIIVNVDFSQAPYKLEGKSGKTYLAKKILIATGTKERQLTVPGAQENRDKILYNSEIHKDMKGFKKACRNKRVAIIGGGVDAMKKAVYAIRAGASQVDLYIRGDKLKLPPFRKEMLLEMGNTVQIHLNHELISLEKSGEQVTLKFKGKPVQSVDLIVASVGRIPRSDLVKGKLPLNEKGQIIIDAKTQRTPISGVYASGDVTDGSGPDPQAGIAAGSGMIAGYTIVEELLAEAQPQKEDAFPEMSFSLRNLFSLVMSLFKS